MNNYEKPTANIVEFETTNVIATSDVFDLLLTWGSNIGSSNAGEVDFYK